MTSKPESDQPAIPMAKPWFNPGTLEAVENVLKSGWGIMGKEAQTLETTIARRHGAHHGCSVSSATAGLHLAMLSLSAAEGHGAPCYIPSFAWPSAANMAVRSGYKPVFTDVDLKSANISPGHLLEAIKKEEKNGSCGKGDGLLVIIHEFGKPAPLDELIEIAKRHRLRVIEDAACALGTTYKGKPVGTYGECGIFSFHPRKSITTGEGGCVITNSSDIKFSIEHLRNHGQAIESNGSKTFVSAGFNYRITDIQAAIGNSQLKEFPTILQRRKELVERYITNLAGTAGIDLPPADAGHSWQTFMVVLDNSINRDKVILLMGNHKIGCGPASVAGHCLDFFKQNFGFKDDDLPNSFKLHHQGLALPLFHDLKLDQIDYICDCLKKFIAL